MFTLSPGTISPNPILVSDIKQKYMPSRLPHPSQPLNIAAPNTMYLFSRKLFICRIIYAQLYCIQVAYPIIMNKHVIMGTVTVLVSSTVTCDESPMLSEYSSE